MYRSTILTSVVFFALCCGIVIVSCKEPFDPPGEAATANFLVLEGFIRVGNGSTAITLTRTNNLTAPNRPVFESGATVQIEDDGSNVFPLVEETAGKYRSALLSLPASARYRLRIMTSEGKTYLSDYTEPIITPDIDSVSWVWTPDGITIYVSTHDPANQTTYYRWEFEEVWEILSAYRTFYRYELGEYSPRSSEETNAMYQCWKYAETPGIRIRSTASLTSDVVVRHPLHFIPMNDDRLSYKYSILVRQHALSTAEFEYLTLIEKNTDQVGTFYDPQPSELFGNITCLDAPDEPVVGFVGSYTVQEERIFLTPYDLPEWGFDMSCERAEVTNHPDSLQKYYFDRKYIPTIGATFMFPNPEPLSYWAAPRICVDCRQRGGVNLKPDFWE